MTRNVHTCGSKKLRSPASMWYMNSKPVRGLLKFSHGELNRADADADPRVRCAAVEKITSPIPMPRPHCVLTSGEVRHYVSRSPRSDSTPKAARYLYINYHITITGVYSSHLLQLFESLQVNIFRTGYQSPAPTTNGSGGRGSSASPTDFVKMDSPDPVLLLGREDEPVRIERVGGEGYGTANGLRLEMRGRLEVDREKVKMVRICNAEIRYRLEVRPRRVGGADKDRGKARETTESPVFGGNIWSLLPVDDPDSFPSSSGHEVASSSSYSHWTNDNPGPSQSTLVREQYIASTLLDSGANRSSDFPSGPSTSTSTSTPQNGEVSQDSRRSGSGYSLPFSIPNRPSSSSSSSVPAGNSNSSSTSFSSPSASNVGSSSSIPADEATISSASSTVTGTTVNANNRDRSSSSSGAPRAHPMRSEGSGSSGGVTGNWAASTLGRLTDTLDNWRTAESYVPTTSRPLATSSTSAAAAVASSPSTSTSRPGFPTNVSSSSNDPERDWFNSVIEADDPPPPTFDGAGRWAHEDDPDNPDAGDEQLPEYERALAEELRRIQEGEEP